MSKKVIYSCNICRDETPEQDVIGCYFVGMKKFKLSTPDSTDAVHICVSCLCQIADQADAILEKMTTA